MQFKTPWPTFKEGHLGQLEHMDEIDLKGKRESMKDLILINLHLGLSCHVRLLLTYLNTTNHSFKTGRVYKLYVSV